MSEMGQKAKYSPRADVFRFTPESRHDATHSVCPFRAEAEVLPRRAMSILAPIATDVSRSACRAAGGSHPTADWSGSNVISFTCAARELGYQYSNWVHPWEGRNGCYSRYC